MADERTRAGWNYVSSLLAMAFNTGVKPREWLAAKDFHPLWDDDRSDVIPGDISALKVFVQ